MQKSVHVSGRKGLFCGLGWHCALIKYIPLGPTVHITVYNFLFQELRADSPRDQMAEALACQGSPFLCPVSLLCPLTSAVFLCSHSQPGSNPKYPLNLTFCSPRILRMLIQISSDMTNCKVPEVAMRFIFS